MKKITTSTLYEWNIVADKYEEPAAQPSATFWIKLVDLIKLVLLTLCH